MNLERGPGVWSNPTSLLALTYISNFSFAFAAQWPNQQSWLCEPILHVHAHGPKLPWPAVVSETRHNSSALTSYWSDNVVGALRKQSNNVKKGQNIMFIFNTLCFFGREGSEVCPLWAGSQGLRFLTACRRWNIQAKVQHSLSPASKNNGATADLWNIPPQRHSTQWWSERWTAGQRLCLGEIKPPLNRMEIWLQLFKRQAEETKRNPPSDGKHADQTTTS